MKALVLLFCSTLACIAQLGDPAFVSALTQPKASPFAPAAGYAAWFKAGVGVTNVANAAAANDDRVLSWLDSSGNGNNVIALGLQNYFPTNKTNIKNGYSALLFSQPGVGLNFSGSGLDLDRNVPGFTIVVVVSLLGADTSEHEVVMFTRNAAGSTRSAIFSGLPTSTRFGYGGRTLDTDAGDFNDSGANYVVGNWYIISAVFNNAAATKQLYVNGSPANSDASYHTAGNTENTASTEAAIGYQGNGNTSSIYGYIAEVLIYSSALSTTDRAATEAYLNDKFTIY